MLWFSLLLGLVVMLVCFNSIRATVFVVVTTGILQDPIRKLVPDEPVFFVVLVGIFLGAGLAGALLRKGSAYFAPLHGVGGSLFYPLTTFVIVLSIQFFATVFRYDEVLVAGVGTLGYITPLLAMPLAYYYANDLRDLRQLGKVYIALCVLVAVGVYLSFLGFDWKVLKQIGTGFVIYDLGAVLTAHPGLLRSPDIAAWHMTTAICLLGVAAVISKTPLERILAALLTTLLIGAVLLTGRRKMIMELVLFTMFYVSLLWFIRTTQNRFLFGSFIVVAGLIIWFSFEHLFPDVYQDQFDLYLQRGATVFEDAPERLSSLGLGSAQSAIHRVGWLGAGIGLASQGARFFSDLPIASIVGGSSEGGLGKVLVELGVPGLIVMVWLIAAIGRNLYLILEFCAPADSRIAHILVGITAFLMANIPTFIVASQVYGDLYVVTLMGLFLGTFFAAPKIVYLRSQYQEHESGAPTGSSLVRPGS